jgi:CBS domain-containing protein
MKVWNLMTRGVQTCRPIDTLERTAELMRDHAIGALPVVDDSGHVVGMITDRDVCMAALARGEPLRAIPVATAMAAHPTTCSQDDELAAVEERMRQKQIHRVPVVDDAGHPVGIISLNDLARAARRSPEISPRELVDTLAAVCSPRPIM